MHAVCAARVISPIVIYNRAFLKISRSLLLSISSSLLLSFFLSFFFSLISLSSYLCSILSSFSLISLSSCLCFLSLIFKQLLANAMLSIASKLLIDIKLHSIEEKKSSVDLIYSSAARVRLS
jgi:hypothetical protein